MNILIVGNGFDLSHYLPTKYDHFMVAMEAIENWDVSDGEMSFDDLFGSLYEKENYFFKYTKAMYQTDEIKVSIEQIKELKQLLKENVWYQYFSDHVREVKTWIDFEQKIEEALNTLSFVLSNIESKYVEKGIFNYSVYASNSGYNGIDGYILSEFKFKLLQYLKLFKENCNYGTKVHNSYGQDIVLGEISNDFFVVELNQKYGFSNIKYISFLNQNLENFIEIFNIYIEMVISSLKPLVAFNEADVFRFSKVYSFNYTNTYSRFYDSDVDVDFLHGSYGEAQNIVLGISDLSYDYLKKIKAYGFTKYHQKLLKKTDYLFLTDIKEKVEKIIKSIESNNEHLLDSFQNTTQKGSDEQSLLSQRITLGLMNANIYLWGHSLDISDDSYINEIFSFNDNPKHIFNVVIFYYSSQAKFDLLSNLLHILGKEKVEKWMKKGWLKFEPNPDIIKMNNIQPVDLPKFEK